VSLVAGDFGRAMRIGVERQGPPASWPPRNQAEFSEI
jgi:hypothetical protein